MVNYNPLDALPQILHGDTDLLASALQDVGEYVGSKPGFFPDDRWIADRARQVIREEDPEVLYVNLAAVDDAGHLFGAAWDPDEWSGDNGFLGSRQASRYSEQARREETLDAVREADLRIREILDEIDARGGPEDSIVVFTADHSMITEGYGRQGYAALDLREYLREQGIVSSKHYGAAWSLNHYGAIFDVRDEATLTEIKRQLQGMAVDDPTEGKGFHPCIVLDREGMKTGVDSDNPYLSDSEKQLAVPGELYSSYYIEHPAPPGEKIRWPDLFVFFREILPRRPGQAIFLAKEGGKVVGMCGLFVHTEGEKEGEARLGFGVLMPWQGRGIARALIVKALGHGRERGLRRVLAEVLPHNLRAIGLLTSAGFSIVTPDEPVHEHQTVAVFELDMAGQGGP